MTNKLFTGLTLEIVQKTPTMICVISVDGLTEFLNPVAEKITGYSLEEIRGKNWGRIFYPDDYYQQVEKLFEIMKDGKEVDGYQMDLVTKTGQVKNILWNSRNIFDGKGKVEKIIGFGIDITKVRQAEKELYGTQSIRSMQTLVLGFVNDFNNIFSGFLGWMNLLKTALPGEPERALELVEKINKQGLLAVDLIKRITDFGLGGRKEPGQSIQFSRVLQQILRQNNRGFPEIKFIAKNISDARVLIGSADLVRIVSGLIDNAVESGAKEIKVELTEVKRVGRSGKMLKFEVRDNGIGIGSDDLDSIFDPYFTGSRKPKKPNEKGKGLGLAIVWAVVNRAGGVAEVESLDEQGSVLRVFLPRAE